jgi:RHS repeat-associated protein
MMSRSINAARAAVASALVCFGTLFAAGDSAGSPPLMTVPGTSNIDARGNFTHSVSITVPPGTGGLAPRLDLEYSSSNGDGFLGLGWSLQLSADSYVRTDRLKEAQQQAAPSQGASSSSPTAVDPSGNLSMSSTPGPMSEPYPRGAIVDFPAPVKRCPRTVAQDGVHGSVNYDSTSTNSGTNDRFCLNGKRLIQVTGTNYGEDGSQYRTEIEEFSEVIAHGQSGNGPTWFEVHTKSGQIFEFGRTADSRAPLVPVASSPVTAPGAAGSVRAWAVNKIYDVQGNYLTVTYDNGTPDTTNGQLYPTEIDYTGSSSPVIAPYNHVYFYYNTTQTRPDVVPVYQAGFVTQTTNLLTEIKTYTGSTLVTDYKLSYRLAATNATHDELTSIAMCDVNGACLPTTTFGWQGSRDRLMLLPSVPLGSSMPSLGDVGYPRPSRNFTWGDFNGDGLIDFAVVTGLPSASSPYYPANAYLGTGAAGGFGSPIVNQLAANSNETGLSSASPAELDGSGSAGLFLVNYGYNTVPTGDMYLYKSNGDGTFASFASMKGISINDVNGDHLADYFSIGSDGLGTEYKGDGVGNFTQTGSKVPVYGNNVSIFSGFAGSGCADLLYSYFTAATGGVGKINYSCNPAISSLDLSSTILYGVLAPGGNVGGHTNNQSLLGDFNGDGKTDLLFVPDNRYATYPAPAVLYLSTGTGFTSGITIPNSTDWYTYDISVGDWNGDGKSDLILTSHSSTVPIQFWLSTGMGFSQAKDSSGNFVTIPSHSGGGALLGLEVVEVADWNNDGSDDILLIGLNEPGNTEYVFSYVPELMTSVSNGVGAVINVTYDRLNENGSFYTKCLTPPDASKPYVCGDSYPTQAVDGPMYVVSRIDDSNGLGTCNPTTLANCYSTTYSYAGAKKDLAGRGFLGFQRKIATDLQTGIVTTSNYRTDFPYIGFLASETQVTNSQAANCIANTILKSTTKTPGQVVFAGTHRFTFTSKSVVARTDCDGTAFPTITTTTHYDCQTSSSVCAGEPDTITVSRIDGSSETTSLGYTDDYTHWCFDRPTSETVQSIVGSSNMTRTTSYTWTACILTQKIVEPTIADLYLETDYTLDGFGNIIKVATSGSAQATNPIVARSATTQYDALGEFPVSTTDELGHVDEYTFDPRFGVPTSHTDPNNLTTSWTIDTFGRPQAEAKPDGTGMQYSYPYCSGVFGGTQACPAPGKYASQATPVTSSSGAQIGPQATAYYDMLGRSIGGDTQGFNGSTIRASIVYDTSEFIAKKSRPYFLVGGTAEWTVNTNDALGRAWQIQAPNGEVITTGFSGQTVTVTQSNNEAAVTSEVTVTHTNAEGMTDWVEDALNHTTTYGYDAFNDLTSITDPMTPTANVTAHGYDVRGHLKSTNDPDMGLWTYQVDALGEIRVQTDNKNQHVTLTYDLEKRLTKRVEPDLTSTWVYDTAVNGVHKLDYATTGANYTRSFVYDSLSRPVQTTLKIAGYNYNYTEAYDTVTGQIASVTYPSRAPIGYVYTSLGYLSQINDLIGGTPLWTANARDAELHLTKQTFGNGIVQTDSYEPMTGLLSGVQSGASATIANFDYHYDLLGNLTYRDDINSGVYEFFCNDALNRLQKWSSGVNGGTVSDCNTTGTNILHKGVVYDAIGNITSKTGVGTYSYPPAGQPMPHAVQSIAGNVNGVANPSYSYDPNGNMQTNSRGTVSYTSYNLTASVTDGSSARTFTYDSDHARIIQVQPGGTTTYLNDPTSGALEERWVAGSTYWTDYIVLPGDGRLIAQRALHSPPQNTWGGANWGTLTWGGGTISNSYFTLDQLKSVAVITDDTKYVVERDLYDPWGKRRNPDGTDNTACTIMSSSDRGFTGQEQMNSICTVNLNARLYDPAIGRFMAADPVTPTPFDLQSINRYAYVGNNPLTRVDPTGLTWADFFAGLADGINGMQGDEVDPHPLSKSFSLGFGIGGVLAVEADKAGQARACCFVAGTLVSVQGGYKPIELVEVGDLVLSRDEKTNATAYRPVTELVRRHHRQIYEVTLETANAQGITKSVQFGVTDDHPWRSRDGHWLRTIELRPGVLVQEASGRSGKVISVVRTNQFKRTYNLEVSEFHTYFVGTDQFWVHNACSFTPRAAARDAMRQAGIPTSRSRSDVKTTYGQPIPADKRQQLTETAEGKPAVVTQHDAHDGNQPHDSQPHVHAAEAQVDAAGNVERSNNGKGKVQYKNGGGVQVIDAPSNPDAPPPPQPPPPPEIH